MATSPSLAAAGETSRAGRPALPRAVPAAAVIVAVALLLRVAFHGGYLNYDARYALLWAHDLWHGLTPDFSARFASTPHPLSIGVSSLALPFGRSGDQVIGWIELLSFGALVWLIYRLGEVLFSRWVGIVAGLAVLTRPVLERDAVVAYEDVPVAALVVGAVLLEAQRRRRGWPVLALLALAGLLRPEAWLLSVLYWAYLWPSSSPRRRLLLAVLALAGPLLWMLMDVAVTGDALHSLHDTATVAQDSHLRRGVGQVPRWTLQFFAFTLREAVLIGVPVGLAFAWRHRRREAALPLTVAAAMTAVFAAGPIFGLPLLARFIRTPAVLLTLFFGLAVAGWLMLPDGRERRGWMVAGLVTLAAAVAFLPSNLSQIRGLRARTAHEATFYRDLRRASESPPVHRAFAACPSLSVSDHRVLPFVRYWIGGRPGSVTTPERHSSPLGKLLMVPRRSRINTRIYGRKLPKVLPPHNYRAVYENRSWRVYAAPTCA
jgi:hypothetical protein